MNYCTDLLYGRGLTLCFSRLAVAGLLLCAFSASADELELTPSNLCVVVESGLRGTRFAAEELTNALYQVFGTAVPVCTTPLDGRISIYLGDGGTAQSVGLRSADLPYDGFAVKVDAAGCRIFIVGEDTSYGAFMRDPANYQATPRYPHATAFGVYDFLERCFDCRFFFAGPLGTLIPSRESLVLTDMAYTNAPANIMRSYYYVPSSTAGIDGIGTRELYNRNWMYHRLETQTIPHTHGTRHFKYMERFAGSHPEYFALKANGVDRHDHVVAGDAHSTYGHLCWTSAVTNEMYLDAKSYLTGEAASVRGIPGSSEGSYAWGRNCQQNLYVDIQPNDAYQGCHCANCQAALNSGSSAYSDIIWGATRTIAQRLIDEGVPGYITQMAYASYVEPPSFDLPTNVMVMVAKTGPFDTFNPSKYARQQQDIVTWYNKVHAKVSVWNYELKYKETNLKGVPQMCPKAWGRYYKEIAPYVFGHFAEAETDRWFFNHLNYYVYSRIAWDSTLEVEDILDDYYSRMYGPAAGDVKQYFEALEEMWLSNIVARVEESDVGPTISPPDEFHLWTQIYDEAKMDEWRTILDRAAQKVSGEPEYAARLALCRREMYEVMVEERDRYLSEVSVERELMRRAIHPAEEYADIVNNGDFEGARLSSARFLGKQSPDNRKAATHPKVVAKARSYSWYVDSSYETPCLFPITNGVSVTGAQCAYIRGNGTRRNIGQYVDAMESNHIYRVSCFIKADGVHNTAGGGGFYMTVNDGANHTFPTTSSFTGTFDWIHYTFTFTSMANIGETPYVRLVMTTNAYGTVFIDGFRMVDLTALAEKEAEEPPITDWPEDPQSVAGKTSGEVFGLIGVMADADARRLAVWAKGVGGVAFADRGHILLEAYLLNCENTLAAIETAKAAFRFESIDPAAVPSIPNAGSYNGKIEIQGNTRLSDDGWTNTTETRYNFYRAILVK